MNGPVWARSTWHFGEMYPRMCSHDQQRMLKDPTPPHFHAKIILLNVWLQKQVKGVDVAEQCG